MSLPTDSWLTQNASEYTINGVTYRNLEAQVLKNQQDIAALPGTAGTGIEINNGTISVDTDTIATVEYVDESVTGFVTEDEVDDKIEEKASAVYYSNTKLDNVVISDGLTATQQGTEYAMSVDASVFQQKLIAGNGISIQNSQDISNTGVLSIGGTTGAITLGTNLSMSGNTLNASGGGGSYSAGTAINISSNVISVDPLYRVPTSDITSLQARATTLEQIDPICSFNQSGNTLTFYDKESAELGDYVPVLYRHRLRIAYGTTWFLWNDFFSFNSLAVNSSSRLISIAKYTNGITYPCSGSKGGTTFLYAFEVDDSALTITPYVNGESTQTAYALSGCTITDTVISM